MKKFSITYREETILRDGKVISKMIPFGSMAEGDNGTKTIELRDYPNTTFIVEEIKTEVAV